MRVSMAWGAFLVICVASWVTIAASAFGQGMACHPDRDTVVAGLLEDLGRTRIGAGISSLGFVVEIFTSPEGGWTIHLVSPDGQVCYLDSGYSWQTYEPQAVDG